ncbi:uncharacterized protein LOC133317502 [Gastrolobium bilobum]|uniref:uncharacterized protein LOC133317502 n=1 Tax=Gastrolobium bilobum TaxID=150636 RepID=UPI002AB204C6|nr:uncharacterized protein LOC133317502 [Gastrolobium bilobum]
MANNNDADNPLMDTILTPLFNRPNASIVHPEVGNNHWELTSDNIRLVANLTSRLDKMQFSSVQAQAAAVVCEYCKEDHESNECPTLLADDPPQQVHVNGVWYDQRPSPQNVPRTQNFPSGNNNFQRRVQGTGLDFKSNNYLQPPPVQPKEPSELEKLMGQMAQHSNAFMEETRANTRNTQASIRNLENQIGQMAKQMAERTSGTFPSNTVTNPKDDSMAITTRSGKVVAAPTKPTTNADATGKGKEVEEEVVIPSDAETPVQKGEEGEPQITVAEKKKFELKPEYVRAMAPYPERKHKLQECQTVTLTEECSAIIQKKFPPKLSDPGSFNIQIAIGNTDVGRTLCDLGASINMMSLSVCKSLGITELKPTMVSLQLADRSLRRPSGIIEDVLVKVDKFIFPADFVVLDMEEGTEMPLLLGRLFLATARAMIDVENGRLELRMNDETITINVFDSMKKSSDKGDCFRLDILDQVVEEEVFSIQQHEEELQEKGTPKVELKELPETLKYIFLGEKETYPVIINKGLSSEQETKLVEVLKEHKTAIGWSISDLKGINPSFCTHKILMEDEVRLVR